MQLFIYETSGNSEVVTDSPVSGKQGFQARKGFIFPGVRSGTPLLLQKVAILALPKGKMLQNASFLIVTGVAEGKNAPKQVPSTGGE